MTQTPFEDTESLRVGTIEFVSPSEIKVLLNTDTPDSVALNTTTPRAFPKVNSYLIVPNEQGFLVGQVEWLTIEHSDYPKRKGLQDFGLVDLPYPLRKLKLNPLGTLKKVVDSNSEVDYKFERGADTFPSVGEGVLIPTDAQLNSIIESSDNPVQIGNSPLAGNAKVKINPDKIFGRHLAVLGNTGSGKSCSVAGLIRWSLEQASKENAHPNARFIILDPNGEYSRAFQNDATIKSEIFKVEPDEKSSQLQVPLWFWNTEEWSAFVQASDKAQRPALVQALRFMRDSPTEIPDFKSHRMRGFLRTIVSSLKIDIKKGTPWNGFPYSKNFFKRLQKWRESLHLEIDPSFSDEERQSANDLISKLDELIAPKDGPNNHEFDFNMTEVSELHELAISAFNAFGGSDTDLLPIDEDTPRAFEGDNLIRAIEASGDMLNVSEYIETMLVRVRSLLADPRMKQILENENEGINLKKWLDNYIGTTDTNNNKNVTIIDLSMIPSEIINILTASIARMIFESLQRYRKNSERGSVLPTCLVMEEAHTFIRKERKNEESTNTSTVCSRVFEKIAREGRKYGLGLVLSSQRPSELSPTVLSQCNSFLLHRISNDRDQDLVQRFVPDNLKGLLRELPSLPSQNAILMGWATEIPVMVRMNELPEKHQPQSEDPDFWNVWTRKSERTVDWERIAADWQRREYQESSKNEANNDDNEEFDERNDKGQTGDKEN